MGRTLAEIGEMSSSEFALHQAYWRIEPTGPEGEMLRWAALMAAVANGALIRKDKRNWRARDFWPEDVWEERKPMTGPPDFSHLRGMKVRSRRG